MRSSGHGSSTQAHAPLIAPAPAAPSSLLPTQTQPPDAPPSSYRDIGDEESGRGPANQRRMSSFLGRSLRGLRIRSARQSVTSLAAATGASNPPTTTVSPSASTALLPSASPRTSVHDPATFGRTSIFRPQSPTLGALPEPAFPRVPEVRGPVGPAAHALGPYALTASGAPVWPGLGAAHGQPAMPSPALTEGSSVNAPEGLLDPRLALRLGAPGMQSQGALSFRDDQDYSRPIGGWVNNRQYSRTTIQTVSTRNESQRRPSLESHNTETTGVETVHPHAEGPHTPSAIEEAPSAS
ncbi:hypothetical protein PYCCODRAFT_1357952 [Trametes coccinea BRFM310]|uniref:Uncharacterized protein n=1 Tax=Trametes coccinea (strain BRFM310) TaxID=1353009 RepID=A0A1Y2J4K8_TRAC3|nr:hypothetical protein PYCCODRAFT_1357952 [Trametes coccinea BRFM310]